MGGVWRYVLARSPDEIVRAFPELSVVDRVPDWMSSERYAELVAHLLDVRNPSGLLADIIAERDH